MRSAMKKILALLFLVFMLFSALLLWRVRTTSQEAALNDMIAVRERESYVNRSHHWIDTRKLQNRFRIGPFVAEGDESGGGAGIERLGGFLIAE